MGEVAQITEKVITELKFSSVFKTELKTELKIQSRTQTAPK